MPPLARERPFSPTVGEERALGFIKTTTGVLLRYYLLCAIYTVFVQTLTLCCSLKLTPEQAALEATVRLCNHVLRVAKQHRGFRRLPGLSPPGLSANLAVQAIA
jgi:hypothetical protein